MAELMENPVFHSKIKRGAKTLNNSLEELVVQTSVKPINRTNKTVIKEDLFSFQPKNDKYYMPKTKHSRYTKVRTIGDIRAEYEKDMFETLDVKKKENYLLQKIRTGCISNKSKNVVVKLLGNNDPLSKISWQMLVNLNIYNKAHPIQYVLWNGQNIRINGSCGGDKKYLLHFDIGKKQMRAVCERNNSKKVHGKKSLLQKSLSVKFKPGPLRRKIDLDYSYQKYNVSDVRVIKLPQVALSVIPTYGIPIEPTISNILNSQKEIYGRMTDKWAEFSATAVKFSEPTSKVQANPTNNIVFNLDYKNNQKHLIMRHHDDKEHTAPVSENFPCRVAEDEEIIKKEVHTIMDEILQSVVISVSEDTFYTGVDDPRPIESEVSHKVKSLQGKQKSKRKFVELQRLDVTLIRLDDTPKTEDNPTCYKLHCQKGCVCLREDKSYTFKNHCGRVDCMFKCKCSFSRYKAIDEVQENFKEMIPGLMNFKNNLNSKLAKEEQKFHQTVVLTDDKSIVLKAQRRNLKAPKRNADFYSKNDGLTKILSVNLLKIPSEGIEPWCMVHNLYRCFCKGIFVNSYNREEPEISEVNPLQSEYIETEPDSDSPDNQNSTNEQNSELYGYYSRCARILPFEGRRFHAEFYSTTNNKIKAMEEKDSRLQDKLMKILSGAVGSETSPNGGNTDVNVNTNSPLLKPATECNPIILSSSDEDSRGISVSAMSSSNLPSGTGLPNKTKLISWLEANYRHYKQRLEKGKLNIPIEAPKPGKIALYPWLVILERFRSKKNYFCVTLQKPYRIFMAVSLKSDFFSNCIMINQIPFKDVSKYPITVRNLLQDASDLNENFYILCGLEYCWELVGSVTKLGEKYNQFSRSDSNENSTYNSEIGLDEEECPNTSSSEDNMSATQSLYDLMRNEDCPEINYDCQMDESKWFVMTVANDFTEIQFSHKGFFVKYENIVKAISASQVYGRTVRLSSHKFSGTNDSPQFGIYAVPKINECCVFIGPYEKDEPLGIECIKSIFSGEESTKGYWIRTKKIENTNVVDNPLFFISKTKQYENYSRLVENVDKSCRPPIPLVRTTEAGPHEQNKLKSNSRVLYRKIAPKPKIIKVVQQGSLRTKMPSIGNPAQTSTVKSNKNSVKAVKPIIIRKTSGRFEINSTGQSLLKCMIPSSSSAEENLANPHNGPHVEAIAETMIPIIKDTFSLSQQPNTIIPKKPVAEIAPQVNSLKTAKPVDGSRRMMILEPTEINERFLSKDDAVSLPSNQNNFSGNESNADASMDIEDFLASSEICAAPDEDVEITDENNIFDAVRPVWIECSNIPSLGWLYGKKNVADEISFEFPGFKYTDFYPEEEAITKINQVLSRKVYVPKNLKVEWRVVGHIKELRSPQKLSVDNMGPGFILTKQGIKSKGKKPMVNDIEILKNGLKKIRDLITPSTKAPECSSSQSMDSEDSDVEMKYEIDEES